MDFLHVGFKQILIVYLSVKENPSTELDQIRLLVVVLVVLVVLNHSLTAGRARIR